MKGLSTEKSRILTLLRDIYFEVVPQQFCTYCSLTAEVSKVVLQHFGIDSTLTPCQVWYSAPQKNIVVGFADSKVPNKWDGHVICTTNGWFIDAALSHFKIEFALDVPAVVAGRTFTLASQVISRIDINAQDRLWWHRAPPKADLTIPPSPPELVNQLAEKLIHRLSQIQ